MLGEFAEDVTDRKTTGEALTELDLHFWRAVNGQTEGESQEVRDFIIPTGAYLGEALVEELGGRWVLRRSLEECYVVLGDRAWKPFLRARHCLRNRHTVLDYSLTQFFREAERSLKAS